VSWPSDAPIGAVFAVNGSWVARELVITNAGQEVGRLPAYTGGLLLGLRVNWDW
jgi:hypothetical protein